MRFSVLGCGRWGSFIGWYLEQIGHTVCIWGREGSKNLERMRQGQMGACPKQLKITTDLEEALAFGEAIAISISAQNLRAFLQREVFQNWQAKPTILCMKGLEEGTGTRLSRIAADVLGEEQVAVWLGPGHVEDFLAGIPNCMVIDAYTEERKAYFVEVLKGKLIRFYYGTDLIGNEIGAAAKNVIGIAAGILDGLELSSLKGALMARGAREVSRLIGAMGGNPVSAYGLAHLGDYEATVFSPYSRNRKYGELFVKGEQLEHLAEGVATTAALHKLAKKHGVELPISEAIYDMLYHRASPDEISERLFMRDLKMEF